MRLLLLLLLPSLLCAQREDSLSLHRNVRLAWQPHRCINSAGLYGYVDSFHRVLVPFEYEKLDTLPEDINRNEMLKGQRWELWGRSKGKICLINAKLEIEER